MALEDAELKELESLIAVSRKRALNFGLCLAKQPEDTALILDRRRNPEILGKQAKKAAGTAMMTFGTLQTEAKIMVFTCLAEPPPGIVNRLKRYFKVNNLKLKARILDANGALLEEDTEDDEDDIEDVAVAPPPEDLQQREKWEKVFATLAPRVETALAADQGDTSQLRAAWALAVEHADEDDPTGALKSVPRIIELLQTKSNPQAETWAKVAEKLSPLVARAQAADPSRSQAISSVWQKAGASATSGDYGTAIKTAQTLAPVLSKILASAPAEPPAEEASSAKTAQDLKTLAERIKTLPASPERTALVAELRGLAGAGARPDAGSLAALQSRIDRVETAATAPPTEPSQPEATPPVAATLKGLADRIKALPPSPERTQLTGALRTLAGQASGLDQAAQATAIDRLETALRAAEAVAQAPKGPDLAQIAKIWVAARDTSNAEIEKLRVAMANSGEEVSRYVAEKGLAGVTEGTNAAFQKALLDFRGVPPEKRADAINDLRTAAANYREKVTGNEIITGMENNPYGVNVSIGAPLVAALGRIESMLS